MTSHIDADRHPISDARYLATCRDTLNNDGALVLSGFFSEDAVQTVLEQSEGASDLAYFASSTHNVYLTPNDPALAPDHPYNFQVVSTKGCITHDQVHPKSPLRDIYESEEFRRFLADVLGIEAVYPYADTMSSINVHFHRDGQELGWHFDNSSFAVTMLIQAPESGGAFEYIPDLRDSESGDMNFEGVTAALADQCEPKQLSIEPGALVMFRGRDALHRITQSHGETTRVLVVFAFNTEAGVGLSASAQQTFYGRVDRPGSEAAK